MASTVIAIQHTENIQGLGGGTRKEVVRAIINALDAYTAGAKRATSIAVTPNNASNLVAASGTVTLSGASGTVGATINGVSITAETAASDTATATDLAAAINASTNALVENLVTASASQGVVTITATQPGVPGNTITLAASGTGATASGARLTGGTGGVGETATLTF